MDYDPTRRSLYSPETGDPVPDFSAAWPVDAICAELSRLAYYRFEATDKPRLDAALTRAGFAASTSFTGGAWGVNGFGTLGPDGTAYVAFRGTQPDSLIDVVVDARFLPRRFDGGGRVHRGFLDAYASIPNALHQWLGTPGRTGLVVTGHSLGAALATILAVRYPRARLVTFGSPPVGTRAFAALFAGRAAPRYVDCADVVAAVPAGVLGFVHLPDLRYIDSAGAVRSPPPGPRDRFQDQARASLDYPLRYRGSGNVAVRGFADHAPINYVSAVLGRRT
jgi:triacylglycerol lipase